MNNYLKSNSGYTVLEVIVVIFIFGCVGATFLKLTYYIEKFRSRTFFIENATRIVSDEVERLRLKAALNILPEFDSLYEVNEYGRTFTVERRIKKKDAFCHEDNFIIEPLEVEILVVEKREEKSDSLKFLLLTGIDAP